MKHQTVQQIGLYSTTGLVLTLTAVILVSHKRKQKISYYIFYGKENIFHSMF